MSVDDNYLQKINSHLFKPYRARDAFNRLSSIFDHNNPFKNRPRARSLGGSSNLNKINPYLHKFNSNNLDSNEKVQELKPPSVIVTPRNKTYFEQLIASSKNLADDEHPILIKNNHGKLSDFVKFKPLVTLSDLDKISISSRTTSSLLDLFSSNNATSKRATSNESKESGSSSVGSNEANTLPTVFDEMIDIYNSNNANNNNLNYSTLIVSNKDDDRNIVKPIRDWNNHHHSIHHLNNHINHNLNNNLNHNHLNHLSSATDSSSVLLMKSTASPMNNHRLTTTSAGSHRHTTVQSPHRTPAHVIITKKGNYTTNNSSKYFATPSYNLEKKKPVRFSLKPFVVSTHDTDKKQQQQQQVYNENDNPIKVNSYEDLDFSYSTTAMPMDSSYELTNDNLNIKHPNHPQLIVHSNQHLKTPFSSKHKFNTTSSITLSTKRNNTKIANIAKWPLKITNTKISQQQQQLNNNKGGQIYHQQQHNLTPVSINSLPSASSEDDHIFTQLQSQHQANKSPFQNQHHHIHHHFNYSNFVTQRPILQVTQLNGVYTKPDSDLVHSDAITVMDHDSSEQFTQQQQQQFNQQTSTTIMHNNLVVSYKPGRPLPSSLINTSGEQLAATTPSYLMQQSEQQIAQSNILNTNNNKKPDQLKQPSPQLINTTKTNYTLIKLPKPPIKHKPINSSSSSSNNNHKFNFNHHVNSIHHQASLQQSFSSAAQPPRRVGVLPFSQISQQTTQQTEQQPIHQQQLISSTHNHTTTSSSHHNTTSGHQNHKHPSGYSHAIYAPPLPSMPISTPSPQIVNRNPLLAYLGVDSLTQLLDRSFLFRTFVVILTLLLLPPLTVVAAITSIG